jgi:hypothetical protein
MLVHGLQYTYNNRYMQGFYDVLNFILWTTFLFLILFNCLINKLLNVFTVPIRGCNTKHSLKCHPHMFPDENIRGNLTGNPEIRGSGLPIKDFGSDKKCKMTKYN